MFGRPSMKDWMAIEEITHCLTNFVRKHEEKESLLSPEPTLSVTDLSKRWGIDSLADAEYLRLLGFGRPAIRLTVSSPQTYAPQSIKLSDVIAFEARMAFTGKTVAILLAERDKAAATK